MNEEYLWDRSGPPDPEIERLERALAPLRYRHRAQFAGRAAAPRRLWWAAAAAVVVAALALSRAAVPGSYATGWQVSRLEGAARMGAREAAPAMALRRGDVLRTAPSSELSLQADAVGQIDLGPDSELRAASGSKLRLERGRLHAFIWARPRQFVVDTPSARAVDLGCEYTINVDAAGNGLIRVQMGWVAFQFAGHESFIPARAACVTRKGRGPGIPFYEDAPGSFRRSLAAFEDGDAAALGGI
ncbi:MAG TPA: FecR domain-containing protein [Candidatus Sulfopaludibacter sp.]|nr:FecR domain-containing protein [Candidatus Sulfopaludibacter sp.]